MMACSRKTLKHRLIVVLDTIKYFGIIGFLINSACLTTKQAVNTELGLAEMHEQDIVSIGDTLYVANTKKHIIQKIDIKSGITITLAGQENVVGSVDGVGASALFNSPRGITSNPANPNLLYVADTENCIIRTVNTKTSNVTRIAGLLGTSCNYVDGDNQTATFRSPKGLAYFQNKLYIADTRVVRVLDLQTKSVSTLAGDPTKSNLVDGIGTAAQFRAIFDIIILNDKLYLTDIDSHAIRSVDINSAEVKTVAGNGTAGFTNGNLASSLFKNPEGITSDGINRIYVADKFNHSIRYIDISTSTVGTLFGNKRYVSDIDGSISSSRTTHPSGVHFSPTHGIFVGNHYGVRLAK